LKEKTVTLALKRGANTLTTNFLISTPGTIYNEADAGATAAGLICA